MGNYLERLSQQDVQYRPRSSPLPPTPLVSKPFPPEPAFAPEIAFLRAYGVAPAVLIAATEAAKCGVSADQALLGEGLMPEEDYYRALAKKLRAPYYCGELAISPDVNPAKAVASGMAALSPNPLGLRAVLAPRGASIAFLLSAAEQQRLPASFVICSPQRLAALLRTRMGEQIAREASNTVERLDPALSARRGLSRGQLVFVAAALILASFAALAAPVALTLPASIFLWLLFACAVAIRLTAMAANRAPTPAPEVADADLPIYSIIVPLYREARGVARLVAALDAIDYPAAKLDIKLVVEERDVETLRAIARLHLPARYDIVVAPKGRPATKPRALNVALPFARGAHVVVYDAEDSPAPDQLRKAAARFAADPGVDCLQARLVVENIDDCRLTRLFAIEYCVLFDMINPGLASLGAPLPLGGTSNHFRSDVLREVGAWDAWNVTEDADLGLRLALFGRKVGALDSDTYEEAPGELKAWLAQRSRWLKGWMQTLVVHSRQPRMMARRMGAARALVSLVLTASTVLSSLFGPIMMVVALWRTFGPSWLGAPTSIDIWSAVITLLLLVSGSQATLIGAFIALGGRRLGRLHALLPQFLVYHALIPVAAWMALFDLVWRPHFWAKTEHGKARTSIRLALAAA